MESTWLFTDSYNQADELGYSSLVAEGDLMDLMYDLSTAGV